MANRFEGEVGSPSLVIVDQSVVEATKEIGQDVVATAYERRRFSTSEAIGLAVILASRADQIENTSY